MIAHPQVKRLLGESYDRVRALLARHAAELHAIAGALLEKETLTAVEARECSANRLPCPALPLCATLTVRLIVLRSGAGVDVQVKAVLEGMSSAPAAAAAGEAVLEGALVTAGVAGACAVVSGEPGTLGTARMHADDGEAAADD